MQFPADSDLRHVRHGNVRTVTGGGSMQLPPGAESQPRARGFTPPPPRAVTPPPNGSDRRDPHEDMRQMIFARRTALENKHLAEEEPNIPTYLDNVSNAEAVATSNGDVRYSGGVSAGMPTLSQLVQASDPRFSRNQPNLHNYLEGLGSGTAAASLRNHHGWTDQGGAVTAPTSPSEMPVAGMPVAQARPLPATSQSAPSAMPMSQAVLVSDATPGNTSRQAAEAAAWQQHQQILQQQQIQQQLLQQQRQPDHQQHQLYRSLQPQSPQSQFQAPPVTVNGAVVIALDVDEVLVEYVEGFRKFLARNRPDGPLTPEAVFHEAHSANSAYRIDFCTNGGLDNLEAVPGSVAALRRLKAAGCQLEAVTSRNPNMRESTEALLLKLFPAGTFTAAHFTAGQGKGNVCREIGAQAIVDDQIQNVIDTSSHGVISVLFDLNGSYPWCRCNPEALPLGVKRCESWAAACDYLFAVLQLSAESTPPPSKAPAKQLRSLSPSPLPSSQLRPLSPRRLLQEQHMTNSATPAATPSAISISAREVRVAAQAGEREAKEVSGMDVLEQGEFLDYANALARCLSRGRETVHNEVLRFFEIQAQALQPDAIARSRLPPFEFRSSGAESEEAERIVIDIVMQRRGNEAQVSFKSRYSILEPAPAPPPATFPFSGRSWSSTGGSTDRGPSSLSAWQPHDPPPAPPQLATMPAPPEKPYWHPSVAASGSRTLPSEARSVPPRDQWSTYGQQPPLAQTAPTMVAQPVSPKQPPGYRIGNVNDPAAHPPMYPSSYENEEDQGLCAVS